MQLIQEMLKVNPFITKGTVDGSVAGQTSSLPHATHCKPSAWPLNPVPGSRSGWSVTWDLDFVQESQHGLDGLLRGQVAVDAQAHGIVGEHDAQAHAHIGAHA